MKSRTAVDLWVIDLTFPGYMDWWHRRAEEFEKRHPEYRIDIRALGFFTAPREISQAIAEGTVPAAAEYYFYLGQVARDVRTRAGAPVFTSLAAAIDGRAEILGEPVVVDDIIPALRDYYSSDGELASMPSAGTTTVLYGNAGVLEAAGVKELPTTWDAIEEACQAIAALPDGPSHGITWSNHGILFQQAIAAQGGLLTDNGNGRSGRATRIDLASPQMLAWAQWWRRLHENGHYLYTGKIPDWQGTFQAFAEQRTGLRISSSNDINYTVQAAEGAGFDLRVAPYPHRSQVPHGGNAIAGSSFWLADVPDTAVREGALAFLQFAHNPQNAADRHKEHSFLPLTHAAFAQLEGEGWFDAHPHHRVPSDQLAQHPVKGAVFGDFAGIQDVMTRAMHDVLVGEVPVKERFEQATAEAQRMLDGYNALAPAVAPGGEDTLRVEFFTDAEAYSGADVEKAAKAVRG